MIWFAALSITIGALIGGLGRSIFVAILASLALTCLPAALLLADKIGWSSFGVAFMAAVFGSELAYLGVASVRVCRNARRSGRIGA